MVIWKFPFVVREEIRIEMPKGSNILSVQVQKSMPCIWAAVDPSAETTERRFTVIGTGHPFQWLAGMRHIATFQMADGYLVWHLFELA